jgi:hypothetical protein
MYEKEVAHWAGNLSEAWERMFSQEIVGQILSEGGTEVRPVMTKRSRKPLPRINVLGECRIHEASLYRMLWSEMGEAPEPFGIGVSRDEIIRTISGAT